MSKDWIGNYNSIFKCIGANNHCNHDYEEFGFYATDPIAIDKLLTVERPNISIWEICAGNGHLAQRLKDYGYAVTTSDIVQRDYPLDFVEDFFTHKEKFAGDILTNPSYKYAKEFVLHALDLVNDGNKVYMFLKLTFLEGKARYRDLFSKYPPKVIYVFSERV